MFILSLIGFNVRNFKRNNQTSILILVVNLYVNASIIYTYLTEMYNSGSLEDSTAVNKPLYQMLMKIYLPYMLPIFNALQMIYYFLLGPEILRQLDCYHLVYNRRNAKRCFYSLIVIYHIMFGVCFIKSTRRFLSNKITLSKYYSVYLLCMNKFLIWAIVAYYKYGTYQILFNIHQYLQNKLPMNMKEYEVNIPELIRQLAQNNKLLNQKISILILLFFILYGTFSVIVICLILIGRNIPELVLYISLIFVSFVLSVRFCTKINLMIDAICEHILRYQWELSSRSTRRKIVPTGNFPGKILFQISLYRDQFELKLFDCVTLDISFVIKFVAFIAVNVVIIIQTN